MGDRVVGTLREVLGDPETPAPIRRELPAALQAIGTESAQQLLTENLLDGDTVVRTRVVTAMNKLVQHHPGRWLNRQTVETALAAEITGHYRSYQMLATMGGSLAGAEPVVEALRESLAGESERIFRLLKVLYQEHDLHSAFVGIQSDDPDVHDNSLEFLDNILAPHVRALVVPLFDRAITAEERARAADRIVGVARGHPRRGHCGDDPEQRPVAAVVRGLCHRRAPARALRRGGGSLGDRRRPAAARHRPGGPRQAEGPRRRAGRGRRLIGRALTCARAAARIRQAAACSGDVRGG